MPSTNFTKLARVRESTIGVTPGSPLMEYCFITGESFKAANTFERSETITGLRAVKEHLEVGKAVQGGGNFEWGLKYHDWALELALFDSFAAMEEAYNVTADSNITQVTSATETLLAAGDWVEGMMIQTTGLEVSTNNKTFRAQSGSGSGTVVGPSSTFTDDDAAPAAGARVHCIGIAGASDDLSAVADGIATAGDIDFTDFPITAGVGVKIKGFGNTNLDIFAVIDEVTAGKLKLRNLPAGWTTDDGSGKDIELYIGDYAGTGDTVLTDTLEKTNTKMSPQVYEAMRGMAAQTLNFELGLNTRIRGNLSMIGFYTDAPSTTALGASYANPPELGSIMKTGSNIARLCEGGLAIAGASACQRMSWTLNNNLTPVGDLTQDHAIDYNEGDAECVIEADYRFANKTLYEKFHLNTVTSQFFTVYRGNCAYMVELAEGVYTDGGILSEARNGEVLARMRMEGQDSAGTGKLVSITRFRNWGNA